MAQLRAWLTLAALIANSTLAPYVANASSVDATQLDYVPLAPTLNCKQIFFRSTNRNNNTLYMMPQIVAGAPNGGQSYALIKASKVSDDKSTEQMFYLMVNLFFPEDGEEMAATGASSYVPEQNDCYNKSLIKAKMNEQIKAQGGGERDLFQAVAEFPLQSLEISIPGFEGKAARIGRSPVKADEKAEEVDILAFKGRKMTAVFQVTDNERRFFEQEVVGPNGIPLIVKMRFQATSQNGSVTADLSMKALSGAVAAQVKGKKLIAKADVSTLLRASLESGSVTIQSTAGTTDADAKVRDQIMESFLADLSKAVDGATATAAAPDVGDGEMVSVAAMLSVLSTMTDKHFSFTQQAAPETATAQVEISMHVDSLIDPDLNEVEVAADYRPQSTGFYLNAGESMTINAVSWYKFAFDYSKTISTYLNADEVTNANLANDFPILNDGSLVLSDQNIGGRPVAIGKQAALLVNYPGEYRWYRVQSNRTRKQVESGVVHPDAADFEKIPVGLSFGTLGGKKYSFASVMRYSKQGWWTTRFDEFTGRLILTAKRDLGLVKFVELMSTANPDEVTKDKTKPVIMDQIVQEYRGLLGGVKQTWTVVKKQDDEPIMTQKIFRFSVGRPQSAAELNIDDNSISVPNAPSAPPRPDSSTSAPLSLPQQ